MPVMRLAVLFIFLALCGLGFAFFYRPDSGSRFSRIGQRIRTVAYAYVAAILISAFLRVALGWGV